MAPNHEEQAKAIQLRAKGFEALKDKTAAEADWEMFYRLKAQTSMRR